LAASFCTPHSHPTKIKDLAVGSFIYAGLFLTRALDSAAETLGRVFTVIITASLVPVEVFELFRHPSPRKFFYS